jgi:hypothetical protein
MVEERTEPAEETVPFQDGRANCARDGKAGTSNEVQDIRVRTQETKGMKSVERRLAVSQSGILPPLNAGG